METKTIEKIDPHRKVGTYTLTNRVGGQIREKLTSVYLELTSLRSVNSENLGQFFSRIDLQPG